MNIKGIALRTNYGTLMRIKMFTKQNEDWGKILSDYFCFNEKNVQKCHRYLEKISELAIMHSYLKRYISIVPVSCTYIMMELDSDSDMVPNSVQSIEIDLDDDLGFSNESETDSKCRKW